MRLLEQLAHAEAAARDTSDVAVVLARRAPSFVVLLRLEDLVALLGPRARFDVAAAVFAAAGTTWEDTDRKLTEAIALSDPSAALGLREDLEACEREVDRARDAMHAARRRM